MRTQEHNALSHIRPPSLCTQIYSPNRSRGEHCAFVNARRREVWLSWAQDFFTLHPTGAACVLSQSAHAVMDGNMSSNKNRLCLSVGPPLTAEPPLKKKKTTFLPLSSSSPFPPIFSATSSFSLSTYFLAAVSSLLPASPCAVTDPAGNCFESARHFLGCNCLFVLEGGCMRGSGASVLLRLEVKLLNSFTVLCQKALIPDQRGFTV